MRRSKYPRGWHATHDWTDIHCLAATSKEESNWTPKQKLPKVSIIPETRPRPQSSVSSFTELRLESNQNIHCFATWTIISEASHNNNSFSHSSMNWPLKPSSVYDGCTFFLTFSLQVRHSDMTVLTSGKLSIHCKLQNIGQKAGFSTLTVSDTNEITNAGPNVFWLFLWVTDPRRLYSDQCHHYSAVIIIFLMDAVHLLPTEVLVYTDQNRLRFIQGF